MNFKDKKLELQVLINDGWSIVEIEIENESHFFQTNDFEPPSIGSVQAAPYLHFRGIDITEFLMNSGFNQGNTEIFRQRFNTHIGKDEKMSYKFSDKHVWRFFNK